MKSVSWVGGVVASCAGDRGEVGCGGARGEVGGRVRALLQVDCVTPGRWWLLLWGSGGAGVRASCGGAARPAVKGRAGVGAGNAQCGWCVHMGPNVVMGCCGEMRGGLGAT